MKLYLFASYLSFSVLYYLYNYTIVAVFTLRLNYVLSFFSLEMVFCPVRAAYVVPSCQTGK